MTTKSDLVDKAIVFAAERGYFGFRRKNLQLPYLIHPLDVAKQLAQFGIERDKEQDVWVTAILHDVYEDNTNLTFESEIFAREWGENVCKYIQELTFIPSQFQSKSAYLKSFANKSTESFVIKVADRLCNVRDFLEFDPQYAAKYFEKADCLWSILMKGTRTTEINVRFGNCVGAILEYVWNVVDRLEENGCKVEIQA